MLGEKETGRGGKGVNELNFVGSIIVSTDGLL